MRPALVGLLAVALACGDSSGPGGAHVVGQYCGSAVHSSATETTPGTWDVTIFYNQTSTQGNQTVRSCEQAGVIFQNATFASADEAITAAALQLGVSPVR